MLNESMHRRQSRPRLSWGCCLASDKCTGHRGRHCAVLSPAGHDVDPPGRLPLLPAWRRCRSASRRTLPGTSGGEKWRVKSHNDNNKNSTVYSLWHQ